MAALCRTMPSIGETIRVLVRLCSATANWALRWSMTALSRSSCAWACLYADCRPSNTALVTIPRSTRVVLCQPGLTEGEQGAADVFVEGASNIVTKADFSDKEKIRELLHVFEEKNRLALRRGLSTR